MSLHSSSSLLERPASCSFGTCTSPTASVPGSPAASEGGGDVEENHIDDQDQRGRTALMFSAFMGNIPTMQLLLARRADVNRRNAIGLTPLMYSAIKGHISAVQLLIDNRASIHDREYTSGRTPLMLAAAWGHAEVVQLLARARAAIHDKDRQAGMTALMWASAIGNADTARHLLGDAGDSEISEPVALPPPIPALQAEPGIRLSSPREKYLEERELRIRSESELSDDSCMLETDEEPPSLKDPWQRRAGLCGEVFGGQALRHRKNVQASAADEKLSLNPSREAELMALLRSCVLTMHLDRHQHEALIHAFEIRTYAPCEVVIRKDEEGHEVFFLLEGRAVVYNEVAECGDGDTASGTKPRGAFVRIIETGKVVGEQAVLWNIKRTRSVYADESKGCVVAVLKREAYQQVCCCQSIKLRQDRQACLRKIKILEMMSDEQLAKLVDAMVLRTFKQGEDIVRQGQPGKDFFIVESGECVVKIKVGDDEQEHRRYYPGDLFGEKAMLNRGKRAATVSAVTDVEVLSLTRVQFERMLGPIEQLKEMQYLSDPRKCIADFYEDGDSRGPRGYVDDVECARKASSSPLSSASEGSGKSSWFAVYRPTSREAIAKMLGGVAVGKGLNVKGKSAKQGRLSGFVPFLQISKNEDKDLVEASPACSRVQLYFRSKVAVQEAREQLQKVIKDLEAADHEEWMKVPDRTMHSISCYEPGCFGLDMPELLLREAYMERPDISTEGLEDWATGRNSQPAFMDMNLHAIREKKKPKVVLLQFDEGNPMNPLGLLIAYAEQFVKPVVSDFDTFLVGSRGMAYEAISEKQLEIVKWSLDQAEKIMEHPERSTWTSCWIDRMRSDNMMAEVEIPEYGFGDPTSYSLTEGVIRSTIDCGAVRHGAECFNFLFPQELDDVYLVVWSDFQKTKKKPWEYKTEVELRYFLMDRVREGYTFPMNPVWPIRDIGWYDVWSAVKPHLATWYPAHSGIIERVDDLHSRIPSGFERSLERKMTLPSTLRNDELDAHERMVLGAHEVRKAKFRKVTNKLRTMIRLGSLADRKNRERSMTCPANASSSSHSTPTPKTDDDLPLSGDVSPLDGPPGPKRATSNLRVTFAEKAEIVPNQRRRASTDTTLDFSACSSDASPSMMMHQDDASEVGTCESEAGAEEELQAERREDVEEDETVTDKGELVT